MSKRANGLQRMVEKLRENLSGTRSALINATYFNAVANRTAFWGMRVGARDRALAGLSSILV